MRVHQYPSTLVGTQRTHLTPQPNRASLGRVSFGLSCHRLPHTGSKCGLTVSLLRDNRRESCPGFQDSRSSRTTAFVLPSEYRFLSVVGLCLKQDTLAGSLWSSRTVGVVYGTYRRSRYNGIVFRRPRSGHVGNSFCRWVSDDC
jgi:hypothetical protein